MAITLKWFRNGAVDFIDWLDDGTRTMGAAEALDGDAEWSEALVLLNISPCMASVSVLGLALPQERTVPRSPLEYKTTVSIRDTQ
jgi:hypothetical protein